MKIMYKLIHICLWKRKIRNKIFSSTFGIIASRVRLSQNFDSFFAAYLAVILAIRQLKTLRPQNERNQREYNCQTALRPESVATLPPFSPIEGQKWFDQISSQWESQKNRFALIYFGKIQFLPPCIWNLPFMSTASGGQSLGRIIGSSPVKILEA